MGGKSGFEKNIKRGIIKHNPNKKFRNSLASISILLLTLYIQNNTHIIELLNASVTPKVFEKCNPATFPSVDIVKIPIKLMNIAIIFLILFFA